MTINIAVIMDPLNSIKPHKDSTFAMLLSAQRKGWNLWVIDPLSLHAKDDHIWGNIQQVSVTDQSQNWFSTQEKKEQKLNTFDIVLMRKDPPFDMNYFYLTHLLERLSDNTLVSNRPDSLRNCGEKLYGLQFPQCIAPTVIARHVEPIREFLQQHEQIILKPLDGMGGQGIIKIELPGNNLNVLVDLLTSNGSVPICAQKYLPEIKQGDKRIILIEGRPIEYCLARVPQGDDIRGNLAAGAIGEGRPLTSRDRWLCEQIGPQLRQKGLDFVGLDVIGDYVTEINVTSPTGIRELDTQFDLDIAGDYLDALYQRLNQ